ncbi:MAG: hypothetical protein Q9222_004878 [Ikaeria aurantiellina]
MKPNGITIAELRTLLVDPEDRTEENTSRITLNNLHHLNLSYSIGSTLTFENLETSFSFPQLTHLCLAHPVPPDSHNLWESLITFAEQIPNLTHLSLAYWPMSETGKTPSSALFHRWFCSRLSEVLRKLQYLDAEGWDHSLLFPKSFDGAVIGPDWTGGWKHVHTLNLSQGPMPVSVSLEGGPETDQWIRREVVARQLVDSIDRVRREHGKQDAQPVQVEHGWSADNFMLNYLVDKAYQRAKPSC